MHKIYITKHDYDKLQRLIHEKPTVSKIDEKTIGKLLLDLSRAKILDPKKIHPNRVTMNSKFSLKNIGNGKISVYTLVYPSDSDLAQNKISIFSSIGINVFGYSVGDVIKQVTNDSEQYLQIEEILYQPEAAGDYHL